MDRAGVGSGAVVRSIVTCAVKVTAVNRPIIEYISFLMVAAYCALVACGSSLLGRYFNTTRLSLTKYCCATR